MLSLKLKLMQILRLVQLMLMLNLMV